MREQKWDLGVSSGEEHLGQGLFKVLQILNLYLELLSHPEGSAPTPGSLFSAFFPSLMEAAGREGGEKGEFHRTGVSRAGSAAAGAFFGLLLEQGSITCAPSSFTCCVPPSVYRDCLHSLHQTVLMGLGCLFNLLEEAPKSIPWRNFSFPMCVSVNSLCRQHRGVGCSPSSSSSSPPSSSSNHRIAGVGTGISDYCVQPPTSTAKTTPKPRPQVPHPHISYCRDGEPSPGLHPCPELSCRLSSASSPGVQQGTHKLHAATPLGTPGSTSPVPAPCHSSVPQHTSEVTLTAWHHPATLP